MSKALHAISRERLAALSALGPLLALEDPRVHLVGGAVRDLLLGRVPLDLDVVVEGEIDTVLAALGPGAVRHERFGTATVPCGPSTVDVAEARRETYRHPGALPEVAPATLSEDLQRRDFTVNALATPLGGPALGTVLAVEHALADLESGRLRILHEASFHEDPTRLWRLVRYATRLGFGIESRTRELATEAAREELLWSVGGSRLGQELRLIGREADPTGALLLAGELGLDEALAPGFGLGGRAVADRACALLGSAGPGGAVALAAACLGLGAEGTRDLLERLAFPADLRDLVARTVGSAPALAPRLLAAGRPSEIARAVGGAPPEAVALAGALGAEEPARAWLGGLRSVTLEITGDDLLGAGVPAGPAVGRGLAAALAAKLDGEARGREAELSRALAAASGGD